MNETINHQQFDEMRQKLLKHWQHGLLVCAEQRVHDIRHF